jgi:hypothetical protein
MLQAAPATGSQKPVAPRGSGEIRLVNLTKTFGNLQAVKSINLTVPHAVTKRRRLARSSSATKWWWGRRRCSAELL